MFSAFQTFPRDLLKRICLVQGSRFRSKMENIENVKLGPMPESQFLKPLRMSFTQNGRQRFWDFVKLHESVSSILYNPKRRVLVFVKQFRPAVFFGRAMQCTGDNRLQNKDWSTVPADYGITIELCAGIVDEPNLSLDEIVKKEVLEECGYDVPIGSFEKVIGYRSGVGVSGDKQTLFYAEISDEMKISDGGGLASEGEFIDVVEMTIPQVRKYIGQENVPSPGGFLFAIMWFLSNKAPKDFYKDEIDV